MLGVCVQDAPQCYLQLGFSVNEACERGHKEHCQQSAETALAALFGFNEANTDSKPAILSWRIHPKNDLPMPKYDTLAINRASFNTWYFCFTSSVLSCPAGLWKTSYHHISVFALLYIACTRVYCWKKKSATDLDRKTTDCTLHTYTNTAFSSRVCNARNDGWTPFSNAMSISFSISAYL